MEFRKIMSSVIATTFIISNLPVAYKNVMAEETTKKPNVIHILADDLGYMDTALYGSEYFETPNLQRLAKKGMTFTNSYVCPLCSPTRASILSGQYAHRLYLTAPSGHNPKDNNDTFTPKVNTGVGWQEVNITSSRPAIPSDIRLNAQDFKDKGYTTGFIGKHHVGVAEKYQMGNRGFDWDKGTFKPGPPSHYSPFTLPQFNDNYIEGEYITDRIARDAVDWIGKNKEKSFFLDFWQFQVHSPYQAKKEYVEYFKNKIDPRGEQTGANIMAAMVKSMDDAVGTILDKLEKEGLMDNTIIIFSSDNGGVSHAFIGEQNQYITNSYPLRQGKASIYEGGIRVPTVIYWPGVTKPGSVSNENISSVDLYPTYLDILGKKPEEGQMLDGLSLVPILKGETQKLDRVGVVTHFRHNLAETGNVCASAVNAGDWKLIRNYETLRGLKPKYELYNLKENISETINLADKYPEKVKELEEFLDKNLSDTNADLSTVNPKFDPNSKIPSAYEKYWVKWWGNLKNKVENDPTIKDYPKVVYENKTSSIDEKLQDSVTLKIDSPDALISSRAARVDYENPAVKPIIENGRTLVPIRFIAENFGANVSWNDTTKTATISLNNNIIDIKEGDNKMMVNGKEVSLEVAAKTNYYPEPRKTPVSDILKFNNAIAKNKIVKSYDSVNFVNGDNYYVKDKERLTPEKAFDGIVSESGRWVSSEKAKGPQYLEINLEDKYQINGVDLYFTKGTYAVYGFQIQALENGEWKDIPNASLVKDWNILKTASKANIKFDTVETTAIRVVYFGDGNIRIAECVLQGNEFVDGEWKPVNTNLDANSSDESRPLTYARMLLPLRAVSEALGKQVFWKDGIINISNNKENIEDSSVYNKVDLLFKSFALSDKADFRPMAINIANVVGENDKFQVGKGITDIISNYKSSIDIKNDTDIEDLNQ